LINFGSLSFIFPDTVESIALGLQKILKKINVRANYKKDLVLWRIEEAIKFDNIFVGTHDDVGQ
jgi:hypothetical protein